jgi:hypothetical protein
MYKNNLIIVLVLFSAFTKAKNNSNTNVSDRFLLAQNTVLSHCEFMRLPENSFQLSSQRNSMLGEHFQFTQYHQNIAVYGSSFKVNISYNRTVLSLFNNFQEITQTLPMVLSKNGIRVENLRWFKHHHVWVLVQRKIVKNNLGEATEVLVDASKDVVLLERMLDLNAGKDTLVRTKVFYPDPLTSAQKEYGNNGLYRNYNGADAAELTAELKDKFVSLTYENDSFHARSAYAVMRDLESPVQTVFGGSNPNFNFTRSNSKFRELNTLFHIENLRNYLTQIGLPFIGLNPILVDPTAYSGQDQSRFSYSLDEPALFFGTGGVPDAEDADVIIHEYTHYLNYFVAPNTVNGNERLAVEEANCDFMACSYSKAISNYNWRRIFNWDGFNEYWGGRDGNSNATYPKDVSSDFYRTSLIWSSMLNDISEDIGRDVLTKLLFQSVYSYANNMSMQQAVNLLVQADSALYNYANLSKMRIRMEQRGFAVTGLPNENKGDLGVTILNSAAFAEGISALKVESKSGEKLKYSMYNIQGYLIQESLDYLGQIEIGPNTLPSGMYIINLSNEKGQVHSTRVLVY